MKIFKGNRSLTPRFNYPVFKFERSRKIVVGRNKLSIPWYRPYSRPFTLFEHEMLVCRDGVYKATFRGFWHEGVPYPMTATLLRSDMSTSRNNGVMYIIDGELPPFINKDYVFLNPFSLTEKSPKVFQFEPKFDVWFKDVLWDGKLVRTKEERVHEKLILDLVKSLRDLEVEKELMGVSLFEDDRWKWFGKLSMPLWTPSEELIATTNELKAELRRQEELCLQTVY